MTTHTRTRTLLPTLLVFFPRLCFFTQQHPMASATTGTKEPSPPYGTDTPPQLPVASVKTGIEAPPPFYDTEAPTQQYAVASITTDTEALPPFYGTEARPLQYPVASVTTGTKAPPPFYDRSATATTRTEVWHACVHHVPE